MAEKQELKFSSRSISDFVFEENIKNGFDSEMEHTIPFLQQKLISVLEKENNPYLIFKKFPKLSTKLDGLPQYGILSHNLDGAEYYHSHNRKIHSLDVAFLLEKIAHNN